MVAGQNFPYKFYGLLACYRHCYSIENVPVWGGSLKTSAEDSHLTGQAIHLDQTGEGHTNLNLHLVKAKF